MAIESVVSSKQLTELRSSYELDDADRVLRFVASHAFLIPVLKEAPENIRAAFGTESRGIRLHVQSDPEEGFDCLVLSVLCDAPPGKALEMLDVLDNEWWLHVDPRIIDALVVTVGFS